MKKKLILHIGQSKTGTTSLQYFLHANKEKLSEMGILYPDVYRANKPVGKYEHNSFADSLSGLILYPNLSADEYCEQFHTQMEHPKQKAKNASSYNASIS
ncbi:MAG: hypothetical protein ACRBCT_02330 [Alphaproteobacteria bacterium]